MNFNRPITNIFLFVVLFSFMKSAQAQIGFPVNGVHKTTSRYFIENATIYTPDGLIKNTDIHVYKGKIVAIGTDISTPQNAIIVDYTGKYIYPSFVAIESHEGFEEKKQNGPNPQLESLKKGPYHWNQAIQPEINALERFKFSSEVYKKYRKSGIGCVHGSVNHGIMSGNSFAYLPADLPEQLVVVKENVGFHLSLRKGSSDQRYPTSQMGVITLIRQSFLDADWYKIAASAQMNVSLQAINKNRDITHFFHTSNKLEVLRALKLLKEFDRKAVIYTGGDDYERLKQIKTYQPRLAIPLDFPHAYAIKDPYMARWISLEDLNDWELAPSNPYFLYKADVDFVFNLEGIKNWKELHKNLQKVYERGLPKKEIINALTIKPASWLHIDKKVGSLEKGKLANFIVLEKPLLQYDNKLLENWVRGHRYIINKTPEMDIRGTYTLFLADKSYELTISGTAMKPKGKVAYTYQRMDSTENKIVTDTATSEVSITLDKNELTLIVNLKKKKDKPLYRLHGVVKDEQGVIRGRGKNTIGEWLHWNAILKEPYTEKEKKEAKSLVVDVIPPSKIRYPDRAYGFDTLPQQHTYFFKNVTLWTNEEAGIIEDGTLLIKNGKIADVNGDFIPPNAIVIDGKGAQLTPGIIDEHSHIAVSGSVNEAGQAVSAEVRIGDVLQPNDINIYRQLAGGVTTSQILHGSANPIGGQSAIIKLRWGSAPDSLKFQQAPKFIKFALGENVKQANWGPNHKIRFPQTRMGVEQVFYDAFYRAKQYGEAKKKASKKNPVRKDLELEALLEILNHERFITCHSYIESEIIMAMRVADSMGFKINTFTHVLEGYKVKELMLEHGAGGSTFSDWWAYKFEVRNAIPYNAAIMHNAGIVTAINSDDAEMGRRLNQEAAKSIKYGGLSQEEAWKLVTLNPAKLLHIDKYVGSLQVGKDADIVLWSDNPLSVKARVLKTFVDGRILYDSERDIMLQERIRKKRARIINLMMSSDEKNKQPIRHKKSKLQDCNSIK